MKTHDIDTAIPSVRPSRSGSVSKTA